jgi:hypothetical protein
MWMVIMWVNFAFTINVCMRWLHGRWGAAAAFGLIGGPSSYWLGARFDAIVLAKENAYGVAAVGIEWMIAMPLLIVIAQGINRRLGAGGSTEKAASGDASTGSAGAATETAT